MKTLLALVFAAVSLSGCVVLPLGHGHHGHHGYQSYGHHDHHYGSGHRGHWRR